jgi:acyl-CoA synthetase (AMP-forming)/AMP-acid ligase II
MRTTTADLAKLIGRTALQRGSEVAVVDGDRHLSFKDLDARSNRLAHSFWKLTGDRRPPVAILLNNRLEFVEVDLALIKAGSAKVPINPRLTHEERSFIVEDSQSAVLITEAAHLDSAMSIADEVASVQAVIAVGESREGTLSYEALLTDGADLPLERVWNPDDPSVILYTSGTTGQPKGAVASFRSRYAATLNMLVDELDIDSDDGIIHAGPLSHGSGSKILAYYLRGARNIIVPKFDPNQFLDTVDATGATATFVVPTMISMLLEATTDDRKRQLRTITYGGAPIAPTLIESAIRSFGAVFVQVYGSAEAPHPLTVLTKGDHAAGLSNPGLLSTAGRPTTGTEVIVSQPDGTEVAPGDVGEIRVRGEGVMVGYWNKPEATEAAFSNGYYRTGDLGVFDEWGYLSIVDRERDLIITGGLNVYPAEVEAAIYRHPEVAEAAVIGIPDDKWGEVVTAFVVPRVGSELIPEAIEEHCASLLAGYKKPRRVEFTDELPKGSTGKVLKSELRKPYWTGRDRQVL